MEITQVRQSAIARLNTMPLNKLLQVIDFIDFLAERSALDISPAPSPPRGSLEDLLACVGIWKFELGEMEEILSCMV